LEGGRNGGVAPILEGQGETPSLKQEGQRRRRRYGTNVPPRQAGGSGAKAVRRRRPSEERARERAVAGSGEAPMRQALTQRKEDGYEPRRLCLD
jgi:hypothetical protein